MGLVDDRFCISYHINHIGCLLYAFAFSRQNHLSRAPERDKEAIVR